MRSSKRGRAGPLDPEPEKKDSLPAIIEAGKRYSTPDTIVGG